MELVIGVVPRQLLIRMFSSWIYSSMQDRYAADYGDFSKCGLLRRLSGSDLCVGLNWYLTDNESHNQDGRHIDYLSPPHRHFQSLLSCDPDLFRNLQKLITRGTRSVKALQTMDIWPQHTRFYEKRLNYQKRTPSERKTHRQQWLNQAIQTLKGVDLICLDPDNGLAVPSVSTTHSLGVKYATLYEVSAFWYEALHFRSGIFFREYHLNKYESNENNITQHSYNDIGLSVGIGVKFGLTKNQLDFGLNFINRSDSFNSDKFITNFNIGLTIGDIWFVKRRAKK